MEVYHNHHIVPRHIGGSDDPENIERLTVEEHAFAHYVLWFNWGRWQDKCAWLSLSGMIGKEEIIYIRNLHCNTGKTNHMYDHTIYTFYNREHGIVKCTKNDLHNKYKVPRGGHYRLINKRYPYYNGWVVSLNGENINELKLKLPKPPKISEIYKMFTFYNHKFGVIKSTGIQLVKDYNLNKFQIYDVIIKKRHHHLGWSVVEDNNLESSINKLPHRYRNYHFQHSEFGTYFGSYLELIKKYNLPRKVANNFSAMVQSKVKSTLGWKLIKEKQCQ